METMPTNACVYYYECQGCHALLKPTAGNCCVFCSYGSVKCPPIQQQSDCCRDRTIPASSRMVCNYHIAHSREP